MKSFVSIVLIVVGVFGVVMVISAVLGMGSAGSPLYSAGGVIGGGLLAFLAFLGLQLLRVFSPEHRAALAARHHEVGSMTAEQIQSFVRDELCRRLGIKTAHDSKDLVRELRVPLGELHRALDSLQYDYKLPISSDDAESASSVLEFASLVSERRASTLSNVSE
jgi:hypothetical protein